MKLIEITRKNARFVNKGDKAILDAITTVRNIFDTFPEEVQQKYIKFYDSILNGLSDARTNYIALGSYLLSEATLKLFTAKQEELQ